MQTIKEYRAEMTREEYAAFHAARVAEIERKDAEAARRVLDMPLWDGKSPNGTQYGGDIELWHMVKDDAGNILYLTQGNPRRVCIWCAAGNLNRHLQTLAAVASR